MDITKRFILAMVVISVFIFLITTLVLVYSLASEGQDIPEILEPVIQYHVHLMVLMGLFGLGSGLAAYGTLNATFEKEKKTAEANIEIIMKFLNEDEREILFLLNSKQGVTTQSEIARLPGMSRLKAHRIVKKLEDRSIVHVEKHGKVNMIRLADELRNNKWQNTGM